MVELLTYPLQLVDGSQLHLQFVIEVVPASRSAQPLDHLRDVSNNWPAGGSWRGRDRREKKERK